MSLRRISAALEAAGHVNEYGRPFNPNSIKSMVERKAARAMRFPSRVGGTATSHQLSFVPVAINVLLVGLSRENLWSMNSSF